MTARRIKGAWWVDFRFRNERVRKKSPVDTKSGAQEFERQLRKEMLEGRGDLPPAPLFKDFSTEFMKTYARSHNKPSEIQSKQTILDRHLIPAFGTKRLDEIDVRAIEKYKASKIHPEDPETTDPLAPKSVNNHLIVLGKILRTAVEWKVLLRAPDVQKLRLPAPEFDFLTFDEAPRLVAQADAGLWRAMIVTALGTGLRRGELLALRWRDVDLPSRKLTVRRAVTRGVVGTPKSGKTREVPLSKAVIQALTDLRPKDPEPAPDDLVFPGDEGAMLDDDVCRYPLRRACKKMGLRRIGWHVLRHTFASHLAMRGASLKAIQELLGHSTLEMTMRYAHLTPAVHRDAVDLLDKPPADGHPVGTEEKTDPPK